MIKYLKALAFGLACLGLAWLASPDTPRAQGVNAQGVQCGPGISYDASTNGTTLIAASRGNTRIYVCGYAFMAATATNVGLVAGTTTSTPCDTNQVAVTPNYQLGTNGGIVDHINLAALPSVQSGINLCIKTSAGNAVQAMVYVAQI